MVIVSKNTPLDIFLKNVEEQGYYLTNESRGYGPWGELAAESMPLILRVGDSLATSVGGTYDASTVIECKAEPFKPRPPDFENADIYPRLKWKNFSAPDAGKSP